MLGYYNYTVILTYLGLASSGFAMYLAMQGHYKYAFICMLFAGLCDMFDGKVARTKKNRTESEKKFGIQIDSLCDVVCFCVTPAIIMVTIANKTLGRFNIFIILAAIIFVLAGVIRLAFFNVDEEERQSKTNERRTYYRGFPVTGVSGIIPLMYTIWCAICMITGWDKMGVTLTVIYAVMLVLIAFFNILDVKTPKPGKVGFIVLPVLGVITLAGLLIVG